MPSTGSPSKQRKTAPSLAFTDDDLMVLSEALRLGSSTLIDCSLVLDKAYPASSMAEKMRLTAERMTDLQTRIEAN